MKEVKLTPREAEKFLSMNLGYLSAEAKNNAGKLPCQSGESVISYSAGDSAISSRVHLLKTSVTSFKPGLSDFDSDLKMLPSRNQVFDKLFFGYGTASNDDLQDEVDFSNVYSEVPEEIRNAYLVVVQDGKDVVRERIGNLLIGGPAVEAEPKPVDWGILAGGVRTEAYIEFPDGTSYVDPTGTPLHMFFQVRFVGQVTSENARKYANQNGVSDALYQG